MKLIYSRCAEPIRDCDVEKTILFNYNNNFDMYYSNELVQLAVRAMVAIKQIDPTKLEFYIEDKYIGQLDDEFMLPEYPESFNDIYLDTILRIRYGMKYD